jgi:sugar phosphate isomerase/epimerase
MKRLIFSLLIAVIASAASATRAADAPAVNFKDHIGLQLYSLRDAFKTDVPGSLDKVKSWGITEVETAGSYGMPPEKYRAMLDARGLKPVSGHFQYGPLDTDLDGVIREAKALGLQYVVCPWITHGATFTEQDAHKAAADFNKWGEALAKAGIKFGYHPHGYEFAPHGDGTLFDVIARETKPEFVTFEMDVFWIVHPGKDPVKLMQKYPDRFSLMHLKDIRKGAPTGLFTGGAALTDCVTLGTGQVDWPAVLRQAAKIGVMHYFIEDEAPTAEQQIPKSIEYLRGLKLN